MKSRSCKNSSSEICKSLRNGEVERAPSVAWVGERKAAVGVSGGRRALEAGAACAGRVAPNPPTPDVGLAGRGGSVDPRGGRAVCPNADWPRPDWPRGGRVAAPPSPAPVWPRPDCPRGGRAGAGVENALPGVAAPPKPAPLVAPAGVRNAEPANPPPTGCAGLAGVVAAVLNGDAGAGVKGFAAGVAGAAPGVGAAPNRGRCSAEEAAPPADGALPLF